MTRYFKDIKSNKYFTTDELGRNEYQMVSHEYFPTLRSFLEFCSVENGGTLQEISIDEWYVEIYGMTEAEFIAEKDRNARLLMDDFIRELKAINKEEAARQRAMGNYSLARKLERLA